MIGPLIKIYKNTTEGSELKWLLGMIKGMTKTQPEKRVFFGKKNPFCSFCIALLYVSMYVSLDCIMHLTKRHNIGTITKTYLTLH